MTNAISFAAPAISVDEENRAQAGDELIWPSFVLFEQTTGKAT